MKPFRFTLHAVLTLRQRQEHAALEHYARTLLDQQQARTQLDRVEQQLARARNELQSQLNRGAAAAAILHSRNHGAAIERRRQQAQDALAQAVLRVQRALADTLTAHRQREAVDTLREKQRFAYERECLRMEHKVLDEFAGRRRSPVLAWRDA